jgi:transcriptional regulator with AAA-type ATPase domain
MQKNENNTLNEENFVDEDILIDEAKSKNSTRRTITGNHEMEYYRLIIIEFNFI